MTRAVLHIGLAKTGTSSLQRACFEASQAFASEGILYPTDDWVMDQTSVHHFPLAMRIGDGTRQSIDDDVRKLQELSAGFETLFLSSERFSAEFRAPGKTRRMGFFRDSLNRRFDQVEFVVVIRSDRSLLRSMLKTKIEGFGMRNGRPFVRQVASELYQINQAIVATLGDQLKVMRFEDLVAEPFPNSLVRACTGRDFALPNLKKNVSADSDPMRFLMSGVRALLFHSLGEPLPNTPTINRALNEIRQGITITPAATAKLRETLHAWIDAEADLALAEIGQSLEEIYTPLMTRPMGG